MTVETIAAACLLLGLLGLAFWAGYGWRVYIEIYRHNRPWLRKKEQRKRRAATRRRDRLKALWRWLMRRSVRSGPARDEQD